MPELMHENASDIQPESWCLWLVTSLSGQCAHLLIANYLDYNSSFCYVKHVHLFLDLGLENSELSLMWLRPRSDSST